MMKALDLRIAKHVLLLALAIGASQRFPECAHADVLFTRSGETLSGRIDRETETHVFFRQRIQSAQYRERTIGLEDILTLVRTIDSNRLEALDPLNPEEYLLYAEELAMAQRDAEAQDLAMRLYLIAAYLGSGELRESAFLGMIQVARGENERNRVNRLAFQVLGRWQTEWSARPNRQNRRAADSGPLIERLLVAIRALRQQDHLAAVDTINDPSIQKLMEGYRHICEWRELREWTLDGRLNRAELSKLLQLEIALISQIRSLPLANIAAPEDDSWLAAIRLNDGPATLVSFENVCEFAPSRTLYRNGVWVEPSQ